MKHYPQGVEYASRYWHGFMHYSKGLGKEVSMITTTATEPQPFSMLVCLVRGMTFLRTLQAFGNTEQRFISVISVVPTLLI